MTANPKPTRIRDDKYRDSFNGRACWNCGRSHADAGVVGAHIRWGHESGMGQKQDNLIVPLCFNCHTGPNGQEANPGPEWWAECLKNMARRLYGVWVTENR